MFDICVGEHGLWEGIFFMMEAKRKQADCYFHGGHSARILQPQLSRYRGIHANIYISSEQAHSWTMFDIQ